MALEEEDSRKRVVASKLELEREIEKTEKECDEAEKALQYVKEVNDEWELFDKLFP